MTTERQIKFTQYLNDLQNDPEYIEFLDWYNRTMLRAMFIGLYAFMFGGFITGLFAWNLSLAFGWVALAVIVSSGVAWSRWYYGHWPWVIA